MIGVALAVPLMSDTAAQRMGCGEFCVRLLCKYYDIEFQQEEALRVLAPGMSGETSLESIQQCLEMHGFQCAAMRGGYDSLAAIGSPTIVFLESIRKPPVGHFGVVMKSAGSDRLLAYDPFASLDPITVEREEFLKHWKGIVLLARPARGTYEWWVYPIVTVCAVLFGMCLAHFRPFAGTLKVIEEPNMPTSTR